MSERERKKERTGRGKRGKGDMERIPGEKRRKRKDVNRRRKIE